MSDHELVALAHELAYESCQSILDGCCGQDVDIDREPGVWFDTDDVAEFAGADVQQALDYLDARGLLIAHPRKPN